MKVTCRYSGIEFRAEHFNLSVLGEHPLFLLSTDRLLNLYKTWLLQEQDKPEIPHLGETETKLLFVALLKATELVRFDIPARPNFVNSTKNLPKLAEFVIFKQSIPQVETVFSDTAGRIPFPHVVISQETQDCSGAINWLERWDDCKKEFIDGYRRANINLALAHKEDLLLKLIKSPEGNQTRKITRLCEWALIASEAPIALRPYWSDLFKLSGIDIFKASTVDLEELLEHMEDNLPSGSTFSFETLRHIREIYIRNKKGLLFNLGGDLEADDTILDPFDLTNNPYRFVEDDMETINSKIAALNAPTEEPIKANYPNLVAYLRAKSAFHLAKHENQVRIGVEERERAYLAKVAKDNPGEDADMEDISSEIEQILKDGG